MNQQCGVLAPIRDFIINKKNLYSLYVFFSGQSFLKLCFTVIILPVTHKLDSRIALSFSYQEQQTELYSIILKIETTTAYKSKVFVKRSYTVGALLKISKIYILPNISWTVGNSSGSDCGDFSAF